MAISRIGRPGSERGVRGVESGAGSFGRDGCIAGIDCRNSDRGRDGDGAEQDRAVCDERRSADLGEYRKVLAGAGTAMELTPLERFAFYEAAAARDVCLTIATGEQKIYANLLLTIGVVR